jgi:hypothetical protein
LFYYCDFPALLGSHSDLQDTDQIVAVFHAPDESAKRDWINDIDDHLWRLLLAERARFESSALALEETRNPNEKDVRRGHVLWKGTIPERKQDSFTLLCNYTCSVLCFFFGGFFGGFFVHSEFFCSHSADPNTGSWSNVYLVLAGSCVHLYAAKSGQPASQAPLLSVHLLLTKVVLWPVMDRPHCLIIGTAKYVAVVVVVVVVAVVVAVVVVVAAAAAVVAVVVVVVGFCICFNFEDFRCFQLSILTARSVVYLSAPSSSSQLKWVNLFRQAIYTRLRQLEKTTKITKKSHSSKKFASLASSSAALEKPTPTATANPNTTRQANPREAIASLEKYANTSSNTTYTPSQPVISVTHANNNNNDEAIGDGDTTTTTSSSTAGSEQAGHVASSEHVPSVSAHANRASKSKRLSTVFFNTKKTGAVEPVLVKETHGKKDKREGFDYFKSKKAEKGKAAYTVRSFILSLLLSFSFFLSFTFFLCFFLSFLPSFFLFLFLSLFFFFLSIFLSFSVSFFLFFFFSVFFFNTFFFSLFFLFSFVRSFILAFYMDVRINA